jgi:hypothetical protein
MNVLQKYKNILVYFILIFLSIVFLSFFIKGDKGNPIYYQTERNTKVGSPFESSGSSSRFALTEAIIENNSVTLTKEQARFAAPDVSLYNDKFFTTFMPGVSFIGAPFYLLGKQFGLQQLFAYFSVTLFGLLNMILIAVIAYRLGANLFTSLLSGFLFLFATNALSYSLFYTQHSTSTTFLLLSILTVLGKRTVLKTILFGICLGAGLLLDIPNLFLLLPVAIYLVAKHISILNEKSAFKVIFNTKLFALLIGFIPFLIILFWYNLHTTGTYTKIGQTVGRSLYFTDLKQVNLKEEEKDAPTTFALPFVPRAQINGMYTLLISNERAWLYYSPIVLIGILGLITMYKDRKKRGITNTLVAIVVMDIILYSMFGDPWGGWAFGPRYLIPAAAILCIALAVAIKTYKTRLWFVIVFAGTAIYSLFINVLGAVTTSALPPKVEATYFKPPIPYTYDYNFQLASTNNISALFYNMFFSHVSGWTYIILLTAVLVMTTVILYLLAVRQKERSLHE